MSQSYSAIDHEIRLVKDVALGKGRVQQVGDVVVQVARERDVRGEARLGAEERRGLGQVVGADGR